MKRLSGQCMSACIFPYFRGEYRYLDDDSAIGIHRFSFGKDFGGAITSEVSQELSGKIVAFIKRGRADSSLFTLMTQTPPDDIYVLPRDGLVKLRVVTGDIYSEAWAYEVHGDISYLKADQVTWRGENKIIFGCPPNDMKKHMPIMMIFSELPDRESIARQAKNVILIINGKNAPPKLAGDSHLQWTIALTPEQVDALKMADYIGAGVAPGPPEAFSGFAGINVGEGREKLVRTLNDCRDVSLDSVRDEKGMPPPSVTWPYGMPAPPPDYIVVSPSRDCQTGGPQLSSENYESWNGRAPDQRGDMLRAGSKDVRKIRNPVLLSARSTGKLSRCSNDAESQDAAGCFLAVSKRPGTHNGSHVAHSSPIPRQILGLFSLGRPFCRSRGKNSHLYLFTDRADLTSAVELVDAS